MDESVSEKVIKSKSRARSKSAKAKQLDEILNVGRELFISMGIRGFSLKSLAARFGMQQSNLYNYFSSKRELFYAIISQGHKKLEKALQEVVDRHSGTQIDLLLRLSQTYLELENEESDMFRLMFSVPAPPKSIAKSTGKPKPMGKYEKNFRPNDSFHVLKSVVEKGIANGELRKIDANILSHYLWSVVHGGSIVSNYFVVDEESEVDEKTGRNIFRKFLMSQIQNQLNYFYKNIEFFES